MFETVDFHVERVYDVDWTSVLKGREQSVKPFTIASCSTASISTVASTRIGSICVGTISIRVTVYIGQRTFVNI
jgi:hypothetical protein